MILGNANKVRSPPKYRKSLEPPTAQINKVNPIYTSPMWNMERKVGRGYEKQNKNTQSLQEINLMRRRPETSSNQHSSLLRNRSGNVSESNMSI